MSSLASFVVTLTMLASLARAGTGSRAGEYPCDVPTGASETAVADLRAALEAHGGAVRWDLARGPIRVWQQRRPEFAHDVSATPAEWRRALSVASDSWRGIVSGLEFRIVRDSADADVIVTWEHDLANAPSAGELAYRTAGRTTLVPAGDGRALLAHVRLAVFAPGGARYTLEDVRAVARHELGHALGLADHGAPASVMAPLVRAERLTDDDRATLRALYALPIGARCAMPTDRAGSSPPPA